MSEDFTEELKNRLVRDLTEAPQGVNDSQMPPPGNPNPTGEVGPSPRGNSIPSGDPARTGGGLGPGETGEEEDPGIADAGGVNASNTDGSARQE